MHAVPVAGGVLDAPILLISAVAAATVWLLWLPVAGGQPAVGGTVNEGSAAL